MSVRPSPTRWPPSQAGGERTVLALGWATVELDRAETELRAAFTATFVTATDAPGDDLLGAHCRTLLTGDPRVPVIILLEPSTEGRLAVTLARHGEGPAAAWSAHRPMVRCRSDGPSPPRAPWAGRCCCSTGRDTGPHRLLVLGGPGTISS